MGDPASIEGVLSRGIISGPVAAAPLNLRWFDGDDQRHSYLDQLFAPYVGQRIRITIEELPDDNPFPTNMGRDSDSRSRSTLSPRRAY